MAAPLVIGSDVRNLSVTCIEMLCNADVIAIDQDPLGIHGTPVRRHGGTDVWVKPLANGDHAVALLKRTAAPARIVAGPDDLAIVPSQATRVRNLWTGTVEHTSGSLAAEVPPHGAVLHRVTTVSATSPSELG